MTFTEEDAKNDGRIKSETGREMVKVAKSNNPELFEHFQNVCEEKGRAPADVLGEGALRAIKSQDFSDRVLGAEVSVSQLNREEIRTQDVKYVKQLTDELGLDDDDKGDSPIDKLIQQRLESVSSSPVPKLNNRGGGGAVDDEQLARTMEAINNKIDNLERKVESSAGSEQTEAGSSGNESIDDIFSDDGGDGEAEPEVVEKDADTQEEQDGEAVEEEDEGPVIEPDIAGSIEDDNSDEDGGDVIEEEIDLSEMEDSSEGSADEDIMQSEGADEE